MKNIVRSTIVVVGIAGVALGTAGIAGATEQDYINELYYGGFGQFSTQSALMLGYAVCTAESKGVDHDTMVTRVYANTVADITPGNAAYIVEAAEAHLC